MFGALTLIILYLLLQTVLLGALGLLELLLPLDVDFHCKTARCGRCTDEDFCSGTNPSTSTSF